MMKIDLNCDLGEGFGAWEMGNDAAMIELATSVNIACGFHAGDSDIMRKTVELAKARGVSVGAHPGYRDLHGFGRRPFPGMKASEIENLVAYQIGALQAIATMAGHKVTHVKAHGALSNVACEDDMTARAIASAIKAVDRDLIFVVLANSRLVQAGEAANLPMVHEVFADRAYEDDGSLVSRRKPGAVLHDAGRNRPARGADGAGWRRGVGHGQGDQDAHRYRVHPRRYARRRRYRPRGAAGVEGRRHRSGAVQEGGLAPEAGASARTDDTTACRTPRLR